MRWKRIRIWLMVAIVGAFLSYRFAAYYFALPPVMRFLAPGVCLTVDEATYKNVGRAEFYEVYLSCDTIAKEEYVEVYAIRNDANSILPKQLRKRTLVFEYDPGAPSNALPLIQAVGSNQFKISVPEVSSVGLERRSWDNNAILYDIGKVDYPSSAPQTAH
jgi:hypothetical protein